MPEAAVNESGELTFRREPFDWITLPERAVALDVVEHFGRQNEEAAVDPCPVSMWLLDEALHHVSLNVEHAEPPRRLNRGNSGEPARPGVKTDEFPNIDVADAVAIGHAEVRINVTSHPLEPAPRHGVLARIHQRHAPWFDMLLMNLHCVVLHVEGNVRHVQEVVGEVLLDHVALVAAADNEFVYAGRRVALHDVPEDRLAANLHHRLGANHGFLADAGTKTSGENDGFHVGFFFR